MIYGFAKFLHKTRTDKSKMKNRELSAFIKAFYINSVLGGVVFFKNFYCYNHR